MGEARTIPFALPDVTQAEIDAVVSVMQSKWLTTGAQARAFEQEFADAIGVKHAVALNSCTAALHLSLEALGVTRGDLVFMSPYTFAATAEVVRYLGARPVFVDVEADTLNLDPALLDAAIDNAVRAGLGTPKVIIPVHFAGTPCRMDLIGALARQRGLAIVEDAAHSFPAARDGFVPGSAIEGVESVGCFSFYATKTITTAEGGMLTTASDEIAERARIMSLHGLSKQAWNRYASGGSWRYDIVAPGFKYNLTDMAAAMGRVQLSRAHDMADRRGEIAQRYSAAFADIPAIQTPLIPEGVDTPWHLYVIRVADRDALWAKLGERGIGTSVHFIPLHLHSYYREEYGFVAEDFPIASAQFDRALSLPIYSSMSDEDVEYVIRAVHEALSVSA